MKNFLSYLLLLTVFIIFSCQKETVKPTSRTENSVVQPEDNDEDKAFLKEVKSNDPSEFYIAGEFDGHKIYCASTYASPDVPLNNDPSFNALYFDSSINLDNIHLVRNSSDLSVRLALYFTNARISTRQFPYNIPHANLEYCEAVEVELLNMNKVGSADQGSPNDDFSFWGRTSNSIKVEVTSLIDNVMTGTFSGTLTTKTGSSIKVENGKFRIKIEAVKIGG